ncbi:MAG: hypothetical protein ACOX4Z_07890 [Desulfobulbus sp.]|jgi:hypothetical protein
MKPSLSITTVMAGLCLATFFYAVAPAKALDQPAISVSYNIPGNISAEEQKWYKTFQEGNLLVDGWVDISADILAKLPPAEQPEQQKKLAQLGDKIGREWAKENDIRKIDTDMLKKWGKELKDASKKTSEDLTLVIARIDRQVDSILR